jgi:N-acetylglutamate synthase-like GNAT family acetyltransferase
MYNEEFDYGKNINYGGYFKIVDKKVVGFILTFTDENCEFSRILYLLIDKEYTLRGFGTELIQHHIQILKNNSKIKMVYVDAENDTINWYKKLNFYDAKTTINNIMKKKTPEEISMNIHDEPTDKLFIKIVSIEIKNEVNKDYFKPLYFIP